MSESISIRRLRFAEHAELAAHMRRLNRQDRHARFGRTLDDEAIERYAQTLRWPWDIVFVAVEAGYVRGAVECRIHRHEWPLTAELAFSVETEWQGQGIGTELFGRAVNALRNRGITQIFILTSGRNVAMRRVAARNGVELRGHGEVEGRLRLEWPTPYTVHDELQGETASWWRETLDRTLGLGASGVERAAMRSSNA